MAIEWKDAGILLSQKALGEKKLLVTILTQNHGKYSGVCYRQKNMLSLGGKVFATWSSRLEDQVGYWQLDELSDFQIFLIYQNPFMLRLLQMILCLATELIPLKLSDPIFYHLVEQAISNLFKEKKLKHYIQLEQSFIQALGYGNPLQEDLDALYKACHLEKYVLILEKVGEIFKEHWPYLQNLHRQRECFLWFMKQQAKNLQLKSKHLEIH